LRVIATALFILIAADASAAPPQPPPPQSAAPNRLLWSDGEKPTVQAVSLLKELRQGAERGLDPEDYSTNRLADMLTGLTGAAPSAAAL
jgi:hypothetical protein